MSQDDWIRLLSTDQRFAGHRCHDLAWFSARWPRLKGQVGFAPEMYKNVVFESGSGDLASGRAFICLTPEVEPAVRRYRTKQPAQNVLKTIFNREVNTLPWTSHTAKAPRHRRSCRFTPHIPLTPRRRPTRSTTCCSATTRQPSWHVQERSQRRGRQLLHLLRQISRRFEPWRPTGTRTGGFATWRISSCVMTASQCLPGNCSASSSKSLLPEVWIRLRRIPREAFATSITAAGSPWSTELHQWLTWFMASSLCPSLSSTPSVPGRRPDGRLQNATTSA